LEGLPNAHSGGVTHTTKIDPNGHDFFNTTRHLQREDLRMTDLSLKGMAAIVTGSGRNIGRAIALAFAREGASVVVNGHSDRSAVDEVVDAIKQSGGQAVGVMADVGKPEDVAALVDSAVTAFGRLDIAVSNVAVRKKQPFLEISPADWSNTLNVNLGSAFYMARAAIPHMQKRKFGRLIHISGVDGFAGHLSDRAHNIVCKAGVHAMGKALSVEFAKFGITANSVVPGHIDTERDWSQYGPRDEWIASRIQHIPAQRMGKVDEVAEACVYLASPAAGFVTGQAIHVNGGHYMY
jgi:3-oxoacyl-[acyl-carrier protein] reductase